ncbi:alkaline phosphatase D family protein [Nostoc sp. XA010]|uniref:alkaline phosphatase D family protein n=1 Tax=Nostoc sp. XA010 TaxID=2780407 RepID=UPI001E3651EA|nr:alkaline phosphatase D family protein [Nostoc sp. XA010]MCC5657115.1 alkaline phosphatase D family protein [Nostoc sp. XA010]
MQNFNFERLLSSRLRRRQVLIGTGALTGFAIANQWSNKVLAQPRFSNYPFSLGVASGEPLPDNVVLWTRLAPDPLNGGGMPPYNVPVQWQIATDEKMRQVVRSGTQMATPEFGHSVHVEVQGLKPARWYWYQFKVGNQVSPIGRTRTAPNPRDRVERFRFAFASCQNWEQGYFAAYKNMAQEDLDLVVHLGDYIYEGAPRTNALRPHEGNGEPVTLEEYRNRHAQYKTDPNLQQTHAAFPWIVTWDDHEVDNNWADEIPQDPEQQSRQVFLARRAAAFQAYYEHMPLRDFSKPRGIDMQLYRRLNFGNLVEFNVLDTRQYRSDQPCNDTIEPRCPEALDPNATMTGTEQEQWLFRNLERSGARWNVLAQQVVFTQHDWTAGPEAAFNVDAWDGYVAARSRILNFLAQRQPANPVVITGDTHSSWVSDLKADYNNPNSATVGTEFVGTSITSSFGASDRIEKALPESPWVKYFNGRQRGYVVCDLNHQRWRSDYRLLAPSPETGPTVSNPNAPIISTVSFELPNQGRVERVQ